MSENSISWDYSNCNNDACIPGCPGDAAADCVQVGINSFGDIVTEACVQCSISMYTLFCYCLTYIQS